MNMPRRRKQFRRLNRNDHGAIVVEVPCCVARCYNMAARFKPELSRQADINYFHWCADYHYAGGRPETTKKVKDASFTWCQGAAAAYELVSDLDQA